MQKGLSDVRFVTYSKLSFKVLEFLKTIPSGDMIYIVCHSKMRKLYAFVKGNLVL
jgi:hypothetical protein